MARNKLDIRSEKVHCGFRATRYTDAAIKYMQKERDPTSATAIIEGAIRAEFLRERKKKGLGDLTIEEIGELCTKEADKPRKKPVKLHDVRVRKGINKTWLAAKAGVDASIITRYESGERTPTPKVLSALAKALGVTEKSLTK